MAAASNAIAAMVHSLFISPPIHHPKVRRLDLGCQFTMSFSSVASDTPRRAPGVMSLYSREYTRGSGERRRVKSCNTLMWRASMACLVGRHDPTPRGSYPLAVRPDALAADIGNNSGPGTEALRARETGR